MNVFAVIRTRGPAWQHFCPLEGQRDWAAHARFMDSPEAAGVIVLGGPLEGTSDVLLIMRADSADGVASHLAADPWTGLDLLRTERIMPWTLRLGTWSRLKIVVPLAPCHE
jgi:hypothetical protein